MKRIIIDDIYDDDGEDYLKCKAKIYTNERSIGYIVDKMHKNEIISKNKEFLHIEYYNEKAIINKFKKNITKNWNNFTKLPKASELSILTKIIYKEVYESETSICYINSKKQLQEEYSLKNDDIVKLKEDINKYDLKGIITFNNEDDIYLIGWGNLETLFINDLDI